MPVGRHLPLARGELYDPERAFRAADRLREHLTDSGYLEAEVETRQRAARDGSVSVCFRVSRGPRYQIEALEFPGAKAVAESELRALLRTQDGEVNAVGAAYRADLLEPDLLLVNALYYDHGYLTVKVGPPRARFEARGRVRVEIPVEEGRQFRVGTIRFGGKLDGPIREHASLLGVRPGTVFDRSAMLEGLERLRERYRRRGRAVDFVPETRLDEKAARIDLTLRLEQR